MAHQTIRTTLLELVQSVQDTTESDEEAVRTIASLIDSGRVILTGNFAGYRLGLAAGS